MIHKNFQEISLPVLGMGAMRIKTGDSDREEMQELLDYAFENGINYFDTAFAYGDSEKTLGELLVKYPRQDYYLATKYLIHSGGDYKSVFEEQLNRLKTDYIDFYMIHSVADNTYQRYIDNGCIEYFSGLKQKGCIRYFGFSSHASIEILKNLAGYRSWDFAMIQLNCYDWLYGLAKQEYEVLEKLNIPIIAMEPIRGGRLAALSPKAEAVLRDAHPDWSIASWFFRWLKRLPGIQMVLSGVETLEYLKENNILFSSTEDISLNDAEEKLLFEACEIFREEVTVLCTSCNYCINECPASIDISKIIELYNFMKTDKHWDLKKIEGIDSKGKPADCTSCGICLSRCPQKINITDIMKELNG